MAERPTGHQVPNGDEGGATPSTRPGGPPPPEPSHAERCRTLVAPASRGALSTLAADPPGYPYGSVASYGLDDRGNPIFFVSLMAEHTQNAIRDPRASLLVAEPDPLAGAAAAIIQHMNADHAEAQVLFCRHFVGRPDSTEAIMSAVDRYGFEMIVISPAGRAAVRLGFAEECTTGDQVRQAMVALVANARAAPLLSPSSLATPEPDTQY